MLNYRLWEYWSRGMLLGMRTNEGVKKLHTKIKSPMVVSWASGVMGLNAYGLGSSKNSLMLEMGTLWENNV